MPRTKQQVTLICARYVAPISQPPLRDSAVAIAGGRILAVGGQRELEAAHPDAERIDLPDAVLLSGLVNAHAHLELSDQSAGAPAASFVDWLLRVIGNAPAPDAAEMRIARATTAGMAISMSTGVTTVGDITRYPHITRPVLARSPLRVVSFGEVTAMASRRTLLQPRIAAAMSQSPNRDRIVSAISPHAPYSIEMDGYRRCVEAAKQANVPIATHLAETPDEAAFLANHDGPFRRLWETIGGWDDAVPRFAGGPVRMAKEVGLLDAPNALLAHVNYANDEELELLAAGRASVVYCPRTHAYFGHPPHRWREMLKRGINVAVGTDSTASSPSLSLLEDLRFLHRIAPNVSAATIWEMGTLRGAAALGLSPSIGTIEVGKAADLVAFPIRGSDDPLREVLESAGGQCEVWIAGQRVSEFADPPSQ